jgi:Na+-driven multidrug efflux pump
MHNKKIALLTLAYLSVVFAGGSTTTQLQSALCTVYRTVNSILPVFAFALFAMAGAAYAAGQFFGAEIRARAQSWSMSMLTGAIIGILIVVVSKELIKSLLGPSGYVDVDTLCK